MRERKDIAMYLYILKSVTVELLIRSFMHKDNVKEEKEIAYF